MNKKTKPTNLEEALGPAIYLHVGICLLKAGLNFRILFNEALKEMGVVPPQFGLLSILRERGNASQIDLGQWMNIDKATMVKMVDGLEDLKYVRRIACSEDRRVKFIELTSSGLTAQKKMNKIHAKVEEKFFRNLSEKEKKSLGEITRKLMSQKISAQT